MSDNKKNNETVNILQLKIMRKLAQNFRASDWELLYKNLQVLKAEFDEKKEKVDTLKLLMAQQGVNPSEFALHNDDVVLVNKPARRKAKVTYKLDEHIHKGLGRLPNVFKKYVEDGGDLKDLIIQE
jgi:DNA-binding protein H-NS